MDHGDPSCCINRAYPLQSATQPPKGCAFYKGCFGTPGSNKFKYNTSKYSQYTHEHSAPLLLSYVCPYEADKISKIWFWTFMTLHKINNKFMRQCVYVEILSMQEVWRAWKKHKSAPQATLASIKIFINNGKNKADFTARIYCQYFQRHGLCSYWVYIPTL